MLTDFFLVFVIRFDFHRGQGFYKRFTVVVFNRKPRTGQDTESFCQIRFANVRRAENTDILPLVNEIQRSQRLGTPVIHDFWILSKTNKRVPQIFLRGECALLLTDGRILC